SCGIGYRPISGKRCKARARRLGCNSPVSSCGSGRLTMSSIIAVLTSLAGGLAAAYFLLPPQFSFYIADRRHVAELGFTMLLAVKAGKVVAALGHETPPKSSTVSERGDRVM